MAAMKTPARKVTARKPVGKMEQQKPDSEAARAARLARSLSVLGTLSKAEADAIRDNVREVREAWGRGRG